MTYTAISVIETDIYVVADRTVDPCRLQCCQMVITFYQKLLRLFPPRWQHHHLMIASIIAFIIHWQSRLIPGVDQYGKAHLRLDASLLRCTRRSPSVALTQGSPTISSLPPATIGVQSSPSA